MIDSAKLANRVKVSRKVFRSNNNEKYRKRKFHKWNGKNARIENESIDTASFCQIRRNKLDGEIGRGEEVKHQKQLHTYVNKQIKC